MPDDTDRTLTEAELRTQIDNLAMQLLLEDSPGEAAPEMLSGVAAELGRIGIAAGTVGLAAAARVACGLAETVVSSPGDLREGIARLQDALDEKSPAESAAPPPAEQQPARAQMVSLAQDPELLTDFVVECREHLTSIEAQALTIEQDPNNTDSVHSLFRSFHTIKGLAGFLELPRVQEVAHEVETVLDLARNGQLTIDPDIIDVILASADYIERSVKDIEAGLAAGKPAGAPEDNAGILTRIRGLSTAEEAVVGAPPPTESEKPAAPAAEAPAAPQPEETRAAPTANTAFSVRVDANRLDYLMDMVGEMVIAQSMVRCDPAMGSITSPNLIRNLSQLSRITGEVQRTAMAMRMVPIGQLFQRTARVVRDLARKAGKPVELEIRGEDTELDKSIVEELNDPLLHMARNAIDHGLEDAAGRLAAGKDPVGHLRLSAYHQSGHIVVEVSEDGRGLDREKILRKAEQRGLNTAGLNTDEEVFNLIFEPGFSTAEQVTDVSGRGVGMDVVRKRLQKLRGRIDIDSKTGQGTTFLLRLPLTLAIIDGLVVGVGVYQYILPIHNVRQIFRPTPDMMSTVRGRHEMVLVQGHLLPVVRLYRRFGIQPKLEDPCEALMIVCEGGGKTICMMVDDLFGKQEVVIKSLGETMKHVKGIAGATILGDGRVGLIVDVEGVMGTVEHV